MVFGSVELDYVGRFSMYAMITSCLQLNMTYEFSWFNKNNSSAIKDIKYLSTKINYTGQITPKTKFHPPFPKDERKHSCLVSLNTIVTYEPLVPNNLSSPTVIVFKH